MGTDNSCAEIDRNKKCDSTNFTSPTTMTALTFFGALFTAYGIPLSLFIFTIAADPGRVILLMLSAFFWLLSLFLSSILWFAVVPLKDTLAFGLVFSVLFQEVFRLLIYLLLRKADAFLRKLTENENTKIFRNKHILSYVVGLGFGAMSGAFSMVNVLADSLGPGTVGFGGESQSFFMVSAALCLALILCHTAWGVVTFHGYDERKYHYVAFVWAAHYLFSCLTLLNAQGLYAATVLPAYAILAMSVALSFFSAGGSIPRLVSCLAGSCTKSASQTVEVPAT